METKYNHLRETSLIDVNPSIILARYDDELTRDSLRLQEERYKGTPVILNTVNYKAKEGVVKGCNFFYKISLASIFRELSKEDIIPMTPRISHLFLSRGKLEDANSTYEDSGITVYPNEGKNPKQWKHLREQTRTYFPDIDLSIPFVVEGLMDVVPVSNADFEYGLRLNFNKDGLTIVTQVPILSRGDGRFNSKDPELLKTGFPSSLDKQGDMNIYTANNGVRRFCRRGLVLDTWDGGLSSSSDTGRVHFAKNFSGLDLEEIAKNESLMVSLRKNALERAAQNYEARKKIIETV